MNPWCYFFAFVAKTQQRVAVLETIQSGDFYYQTNGRIYFANNMHKKLTLAVVSRSVFVNMVL